MMATSVESRALDIHHDLFGVEGIVVVGVVSVDRARRHKALFVGGDRIGQRLDRRLTHLRVIEVQFAVLGDDVLAATGDYEIVEPRVGVVTGRV
jgi:hypothetical protein